MKPAVRQLLLGGSQQWRSSLPALRAFVTANYNQPNPHNQAAMASPPTVATSASSALLTGLSQSSRFQTAPTAFNYTPSRVEGLAGGQYRFVRTATRSLSAGMEQNASWRVRRYCDAAKVGFQLLGHAEPYRFIVDGKYVSTAGTIPAATSGATYVTLDFGVKANRLIEVECQKGHGFDGYWIAAGDTFSAVPQSPFRAMWIGDSFEGGAGTDIAGDRLAVYASDMLGLKDYCLSGVGSTGWVRNGTANDRYTLYQRLFDITDQGPFDVIVILMGINDIDIGSAAIAGVLPGQVNLTLRQIRSSNPSAQIFVVGAWDKNAPAAPVTNYAETKAAIRAGIPADAGITFIDPEGVQYTQVDLLHPDSAGHATLGAWLALQIKNAIGA